MNKAQLIDAIAAESSLSRLMQKALDAFLTVTGDALKKGDRVTLVGFGSFGVSREALVQDVTLRLVKRLPFLQRRLLSLKLEVS